MIPKLSESHPFPLHFQALCFLAGANSIFDGDKLLTTPNNERSDDLQMFELLGLSSRPAFLGYIPCLCLRRTPLIPCVCTTFGEICSPVFLSILPLQVAPNPHRLCGGPVRVLSHL